MIPLSPDPRVSVAMPVYNGGDYFGLALDSVLAQTWGNVEVLVVDDGSTDDGQAERIVAKRADPRVRYIRQENMGVAGALNTAVEAMTGAVFGWLSHDDLFEPWKTEAQVEYHRRLGRRDAVLFSDYRVIGPAGEELQLVSANRQALLRAPMLALLTGSINGCTIFAPAHVLRAVGPFGVEYRYTQDYRLWNRLIREFEFFHMPAATVRYRVHPGQGSNRPQATEEAEALWIAMMEDRSEVERVQMCGSTQRFFLAMAQHLAGSPYSRARAHAQARASGATAATRASVVVPAEADGSALRTLLASALAQDQPGTEVLVPGPADVVKSLPELAGLRRLALPTDAAAAGGVAALLNAGMREAKGDYIAFLRPCARQWQVPTDWIRHRVAVIQQLGGVAGLSPLPTGTFVRERDLVMGTAPAHVTLEGLLMHRCALGFGFCFDHASLSFGDAAAVTGLARYGGLVGLGLELES
jgi:hypothetical protein